MNNTIDEPTVPENTTLRRRAEKRLHNKPATSVTILSANTTKKLIHELEVHQIELEMQNSELRQVRDQLEITLEKYSDLYEFAPVGYFTLTHNGAISAVNLTGAGLIGGVRSALIGRRFELNVAAVDRPTFTAFLGTVLMCSVTETCEVTLLKKGTEPITVRIEAMSTASGQEFRLAIIDITGHRRAEEALTEKQRELEELNRSLEQRITRSISDLRQKDEMMILQDRRAVMGEMINNIAHQWRQPLNALSLTIQQVPLFYETADFNRKFLQQNADESMELIRHMSQTINDFKDFFKADTEKVPFDVAGVISRTISLIEKSFLEQKITITIDQKKSLTINGYPNQYAQVLLNILMNARDALVGGTVAHALITIQIDAKDDLSVVTISDNAGGIADGIIDKLFDPYFTTKGSESGTGIGLFMSKTIIEKNMGGSLTVHNSADGAAFIIQV